MWTGVTVKNQRMLDAAEKFVRCHRWRGPFELECMVADGEVCLIEINPRFPAWVYLATAVGLNLPSQLLRRSHDLPPAPGAVGMVADYEAGKLFVRYSYDLVTDMAPFQNTVTRGENP
jgi:carbamoyl-phosphate synthase large subunit